MAANEPPATLAHQMTRAWLAAAGGGLLLLVGVLLLFTYHRLLVGLVICGGLLMAQGLRTIAVTRHSLRAVADACPPEARVVKR
jgi:hypothetical protein